MTVYHYSDCLLNNSSGLKNLSITKNWLKSELQNQEIFWKCNTAKYNIAKVLIIKKRRVLLWLIHELMIRHKNQRQNSKETKLLNHQMWQKILDNDTAHFQTNYFHLNS